MRNKHGCSLISYKLCEHNYILRGDSDSTMVAFIKIWFCVVSDEFRSKVACENEVINLICYPGQRVAIFSASFGRTQYESLQCPQPLGVQEESKCRHQLTTSCVFSVNQFTIYYNVFFLIFHFYRIFMLDMTCFDIDIVVLNLVIKPVSYRT